MEFNYDVYRQNPLLGRLLMIIDPHRYSFQNIADFSKNRANILPTPKCHKLFKMKHYFEGMAVLQFSGRMNFTFEEETRKANIADLTGNESVLLSDALSDSGNLVGLGRPRLNEVLKSSNLKFSEAVFAYKESLPGLILVGYQLFENDIALKIKPNRMNINDGTGFA